MNMFHICWKMKLKKTTTTAYSFILFICANNHIQRVKGQVRAKTEPCYAQVQGEMMREIYACTNPPLDVHGYKIGEGRKDERT